MKKIDCPLCGAKDAITYTEPDVFTDFTPGPAGIIGNSKMGFVGGGYDWSHADVCPKLTHVFEKKGLLEYYVVGQPEIVYSDFHSFEDYEEAIWEQLSLSLRIGLGRRKNRLGKMEWFFNAHLSRGSTEIPEIETIAKDPDLAFALLRHRILCGEVIRGYQLQKKQKDLTFIKI